MDAIDFLVGVYGFTGEAESQIAGFVNGLHKCNLEGVTVFCVERTCRPVHSGLRDVIRQAGFQLRSCPLLPYSNSREDTSQFCDWMVNNTGSAPWIVVSHFDIVFLGDYIGYIRSMMSAADMIGNHHDGIVAVRRSAYQECQVGFCGIDSACVIQNSGLAQIVPRDCPCESGKQIALSLDVGELLALRMVTLGLRHIWLRRENEVGKSDLFEHARCGSGHGGG